jgi:hypothetical protein
MEMEYGSKGVAGAGLGLGIAGTALGLMAGGLNGTGLFNTGCNRNVNGCGCHEDHVVNRYEAGQAARIAELETEVKLRDANTYTDQKTLETYKYVDGRLRDIESQICAQAVINQQTKDSFALAAADLAAVKSDLDSKIKLEAERRCCADNAIVNYSNATFYPKMVADVTVGTTTTAQMLYNPIPDCGGCCSK